SFFFFNDTATTEIYTLSLHDALPIFVGGAEQLVDDLGDRRAARARGREQPRSEEHTSEPQSHSDLVCRLLLEKKRQKVEMSLDWMIEWSAARHRHRGAQT